MRRRLLVGLFALCSVLFVLPATPAWATAHGWTYFTSNYGTTTNPATLSGPPNCGDHGSFQSVCGTFTETFWTDDGNYKFTCRGVNMNSSGPLNALDDGTTLQWEMCIEQHKGDSLWTETQIVRLWGPPNPVGGLHTSRISSSAVTITYYRPPGGTKHTAAAGTCTEMTGTVMNGAHTTAQWVCPQNWNTGSSWLGQSVNATTTANSSCDSSGNGCWWDQWNDIFQVPAILSPTVTISIL